MNYKILNISLLCIIILGLFSCAENKFDTQSNPCIESSWIKNKEVIDIVNVAIATPKLYIDEDYIEGYITSNDERGNFFKTLHLQTIPSAGNPIGFSISVDEESLFGRRFVPGRKVTISLKGLYFAMVDGALKLGALYNGEIGRMNENDIDKHLFASCSQKIDENSFVRTLTITNTLTNNNLNTLIELDNVQFVDASLNRTLFDIDSGGGATNHLLMDKNTGVTIVLRTSSFAQFAGNKAPAGSGKVRGVLTKYGSTFQFLVRDFSDFKLNTTRYYNFSGSLSENFNIYNPNTIILPNYLNFPVYGTKHWITKTNSTLKYIEMSSFGGTVEKNRSLLMIPVNFTTASTLSFLVRAQFYNGACLKVYYTTDFVVGNDINTATLYDITSSFIIPTATTSSFASAGTYSIPASITGNGFFVFEYVGSSLTSSNIVTTTMQIDDVIIN